MANTVMDLLQKKLEEQKRNVIESMGHGAAKDYAEYRELVGVIRGLDHANYNLQDLKQRIERQNNE